MRLMLKKPLEKLVEKKSMVKKLKSSITSNKTKNIFLPQKGSAKIEGAKIPHFYSFFCFA